MLRTKFCPSRLRPAAVFSLKREYNIPAGLPLVKARRVTAADTVDIYDFHPSERKYKISLFGEWIDGSAETFYITKWYDQTGVIVNHAVQATEPSQPQLTWVERSSNDLGSNLLVNGDFTNWTGDNPSSWTLGFIEDATNYVTQSSGKARIVCDGGATASYIYQSISQEIGATYRLDLDIVVSTTGWRIQVAGGTTPIPATNYTASGHYTFYYKANATTHNISVLRYLGAASDFTVDNVTVKEVKAFRPSILFDGSNDYLALSDPNALNVNVCTIIAQATPQIGIGMYSRIVEKYHASSYYLGNNTSDQFLGIFNFSGIYTLSTSTYSYGQSFNIAVTHNGIIDRIYLDSVLKKTENDTRVLNNATNLVNIGSYPQFPGTHVWKGYIDSVIIYPKSLSQKQIERINNAIL